MKTTKTDKIFLASCTGLCVAVVAAVLLMKSCNNTEPFREDNSWEPVCREWTNLAQANDSTIKSVTLVPHSTIETDTGIQEVIQATLHGETKDLTIYLLYDPAKNEIAGMRFRTPDEQRTLDSTFFLNK